MKNPTIIYISGSDKAHTEYTFTLYGLTEEQISSLGIDIRKIVDQYRSEVDDSGSNSR